MNEKISFQVIARVFFLLRLWVFVILNEILILFWGFNKFFESYAIFFVD